jgi:hypothetical protein
MEQQTPQHAGRGVTAPDGGEDLQDLLQASRRGSSPAQPPSPFSLASQASATPIERPEVSYTRNTHSNPRTHPPPRSNRDGPRHLSLRGSRSAGDDVEWVSDACGAAAGPGAAAHRGARWRCARRRSRSQRRAARWCAPAARAWRGAAPSRRARSDHRHRGVRCAQTHAPGQHTLRSRPAHERARFPPRAGRAAPTGLTQRCPCLPHCVQLLRPRCAPCSSARKAASRRLSWNPPKPQPLLQRSRGSPRASWADAGPSRCTRMWEAPYCMHETGIPYVRCMEQVHGAAHAACTQLCQPRPHPPAAAYGTRC